MDTLGVIGLFGIVGLIVYLNLKNKDVVKLKDQTVKDDLSLLRKQKNVEANLDLIKKQLAEAKTGKKMTPQEIEDYWKNN